MTIRRLTLPADSFPPPAPAATVGAPEADPEDQVGTMWPRLPDLAEI